MSEQSVLDSAATRRPSRGETLDLEIEDLAYGGNGIARDRGFVVFVSGAIPGDRVRAEITKAKRRSYSAGTF